MHRRIAASNVTLSLLNRWNRNNLSARFKPVAMIKAYSTTTRRMPIELPLTTRLREATRRLHTEVERAGVMRLLLCGQLDRVGYCALLRNLHAIYAALEAGIQQHNQHAGLARLHCEPMFRAESLADDLTQLHGPNWVSDIALVPAAISYAQHLNATNEPLMLAAHAYVRYLGDLSGGQMVARIVTKSLGLAPNEGVSFYEFGSMQDVTRLAQQFRAGLDVLADDESVPAVVDEACAAFKRHRDLFEQLAPVTHL